MCAKNLYMLSTHHKDDDKNQDILLDNRNLFLEHVLSWSLDSKQLFLPLPLWLYFGNCIATYDFVFCVYFIFRKVQTFDIMCSL